MEGDGETVNGLCLILVLVLSSISVVEGEGAGEERGDGGEFTKRQRR